MNAMETKTVPMVSPNATKADTTLTGAFDLCVRKACRNIKTLADAPKAAPWAVHGNYFGHPEGFFEIGNWTSSFFTGMALMAWRQTRDDFILQHLERLAPTYREKAVERRLDMHHDAGFLYTLYAVALYKLTDKRKYREIGLAAAEALYQRFNPHGGFIRAWGRIDESISPIGTGLQTDNMAIIDSLMNLPLLYWASLETGDRKYHDAAVRHADTTLRSFIRADDSVYHAYRFDLKTGQPLGGENFCGRAVESHWSRGASWAIYGFALSYRYTGDKKYLAASLRVARKFNELMNDDAIPVWDFRLPSGEAPLRDTSAAAVVACACQELEKLGAADLLISKMKKSLLANLCTEQYLEFDENCPGVLREAQVGFNGAGSAQNAYTSWGDYFLMEALDRELHGVEPWW